jgi:hypothetical protein
MSIVVSQSKVLSRLQLPLPQLPLLPQPEGAPASLEPTEHPAHAINLGNWEIGKSDVGKLGNWEIGKLGCPEFPNS